MTLKCTGHFYIHTRTLGKSSKHVNWTNYYFHRKKNQQSFFYKLRNCCYLFLGKHYTFSSFEQRYMHKIRQINFPLIISFFWCFTLKLWSSLCKWTWYYHIKDNKRSTADSIINIYELNFCRWESKFHHNVFEHYPKHNLTYNAGCFTSLKWNADLVKTDASTITVE